MKKNTYFILAIIIIVSAMFLFSCEKEDIRIGFIGDLTTKNSQLAIDARNAILLEIDLINEAGGIDGRMIKLVVKDDQSSADVAVEMHEEFRDEGIQIILGHMTSNMAGAINYSQGEDMLFISPSMSTDRLTALDDNFLRTSPINSRQAEIFAAHLKSKSIEDLTIVYDTNNAEYTESLIKSFEREYADQDVYIRKIPFNSVSSDLASVAEEIALEDFSNLMYITQANDTAFLQQYLSVKALDFDAFSVSWSMTKDLIDNGGMAVEGMIFVGINIPENFNETYLEFEKIFEEAYNYKPSFVSVLASDSLNVLVDALRISKEYSPRSVKESILEIGSFNGYYESFNIDLFGDNNRQYMLYQLVDNEFVPLK